MLIYREPVDDRLACHVCAAEKMHGVLLEIWRGRPTSGGEVNNNADSVFTKQEAFIAKDDINDWPIVVAISE